MQVRLGEAEELKQEGNGLFRRGKWNEALQSYRNGLARLPKRKSPPSPPSPPATATDSSEGNPPPGEGEATSASAEAEPTVHANVDPLLERECVKARSVLHANIAACHVKLDENEDAVKACTEALQDDPSYVRALQRRAQCNEKIGSWSALSSAKEDYNTLITLLPPSSDQMAEVKRSLRLVEPRVEEAQKREVGEMVDKLKGLGNSVLGRFGLSTDNFKFEPNGQGGYSLNFSRE
ncbi:TPR-like protein [Russula compacta]|nr:TPR-like protein [Russula compacta]